MIINYKREWFQSLNEVIYVKNIWSCENWGGGGGGGGGGLSEGGHIKIIFCILILQLV